MTDPVEALLQQTRERSPASSRYEFEFLGDFERSVFPIFQRNSVGILRLIGTGFFVAPGGIFATAKHIFEGDDISESDYFEISQDGRDHHAQRDITHIHSHGVYDIAVCKLEPAHDGCSICDNHPVVSIWQVDPIIHEIFGTEVLGSFVFAQTLVHDPEPDLTSDENEETQLINRRGHWEKGYVEEIHPEGLRGVKGRCYSTSIFVEGRASGGPVFNSCGFVVGINNTGFAAVDGLPFSTISSIQGLLPMVFDEISIEERRAGIDNKQMVKVTRMKTKA